MREHGSAHAQVTRVLGWEEEKYVFGEGGKGGRRSTLDERWRRGGRMRGDWNEGRGFNSCVYRVSGTNE